jgi:hypothetical protein
MRGAFEASFYLAPTAVGLTVAELKAVCTRGNFGQGKIDDTLPLVVQQFWGPQRNGGRLLPAKEDLVTMGMLAIPQKPDFRNIVAFDFVFGTLRDLARHEGVGRAQMERNVLVERAAASGIPRNDAETAISIWLFMQTLTEQDGAVRLRPGWEQHELPSEQRRKTPNWAGLQHDIVRQRAYELLRDVINARSNQDMPLTSEPLDLFADALSKLGYGAFRAWWVQIVSERRRTDKTLSPVAFCVLSAALVEGALTFVVRHARSLSLGPMGSTTFVEDPRNWKIDELVKSAARGEANAILDVATKNAAERLITIRQRIHAGRMLSDSPTGVQDLRPDASREAEQTADQVVRAVLDWLAIHPTTAQ